MCGVSLMPKKFGNILSSSCFWWRYFFLLDKLVVQETIPSLQSLQLPVAQTSWSSKLLNSFRVVGGPFGSPWWSLWHYSVRQVGGPFTPHSHTINLKVLLYKCVCYRQLRHNPYLITITKTFTSNNTFFIDIY